MQALALILVLLCCLISFLSGFLFAVIKGVAYKKKKTPELTENEKRKLRLSEMEYNNFLNYTGDEQK